MVFVPTPWHAARVWVRVGWLRGRRGLPSAQAEGRHKELHLNTLNCVNNMLHMLPVARCQFIKYMPQIYMPRHMYLPDTGHTYTATGYWYP